MVRAALVDMPPKIRFMQRQLLRLATPAGLQAAKSALQEMPPWPIEMFEDWCIRTEEKLSGQRAAGRGDEDSEEEGVDYY